MMHPRSRGAENERLLVLGDQPHTSCAEDPDRHLGNPPQWWTFQAGDPRIKKGERERRHSGTQYIADSWIS